MFYQECEDLAKGYPELKEVIQKVDAIIYSNGSSGFLMPDIIASLIDERQDKVSGVLQQLHKKGLFIQKEYVECSNHMCKNLMNKENYDNAVENEDIFECTQCQEDLIENPPRIVTRYRLNPRKIVFKSESSKAEPKKSLLIPEDFHQKLPKKLLEEPFKNTDLLRYYSRDPAWKESKPFNGKRVFFILHFLKDLIPFVCAFQELGLDLNNSYFFYKEYPYPQRKSVGEWLEQQGAQVKPRSEIKTILKQLKDSPAERIGEILIIEDGGFLAPQIHKDFPELIPHVIGVVEQTTRGITNDKAIKKLKFPILSVAKSELKSKFEPRYIAEAVIDNIKKMMPEKSFFQKNVGLFGYGTIGTKITEWLSKIGANVTVYDPNDENKLNIEGANVADSPIDAAKNKTIIIGASGSQSIDSEVISNISHDTYLVSASSELYEINIDELTRQQRTIEELTDDYGTIIGTTFVLPPNRGIHVLANGYPINFWGFNSMPDEASDLILSLILLSAAELASGNYKQFKINSDAVNEIAKKHDVAKKFREFQRNR